MKILTAVFTWLIGRVTSGDGVSDHRGDFQAFTGEMWKYVEKLGDDYERRLNELRELYEKRMADLAADYERRLNELKEDYERRLALLTEKYEGVK